MEILTKQNHDLNTSSRKKGYVGQGFSTLLLVNEWAIPPGQANSLILIELAVTLRDHAY